MFNFYDTRDQARAAAKVQGKFKDFGAGAEKGKRWAVEVESTENTASATNTEKYFMTDLRLGHASIDASIDAIDKVLHTTTGGIIGTQTMHSPSRKPVSVSWRRNLQVVRLQAHINKMAE